MSEKQIIEKLRHDLNRKGSSLGIRFDVSDTSRPDGEWTQFFVEVQDNGNRVATAQIIADVEEDVSRDCDREILIIRTAP